MENFQKTLTVSEFLNQVKGTLEGRFRIVHLEGEVSNISLSSAGHWYFTLKDADSAVSVAMFRGDAMRNPIIKKIKNGDKILCSGPVSVYIKRGTFQIAAKTLRPIGQGDLKAQFEQLKAKLNSQGLFDLERKRPIPLMAKRVVVITAEGAAALQDFLNVYKRRCLWMDILLIPSLVQGDNAPNELIKALKKAQRVKDAEVIVFTRGGGSLEDLWAFNDEALAYEIAKTEIPIISAVGHEVDYSISDFVADLRVETPTAAAQFLTEEHVKLRSRLLHIEKSFEFRMNEKISKYREIVQKGHPQEMIDIIREKLSSYKNKLERYNIKDRLYELVGVHEIYMRLDDAINEMNYTLKSRIENGLFRAQKSYELLSAFNPKNVLERGYAFITSQENVIASAKQFQALKPLSDLTIHFHDGEKNVKK